VVAIALAARSGCGAPGAGKTVYLDPNQRPLLAGRRTLIVDDAVSSAQTLGQAWDLLVRLGADVVGAVVAMRQGNAWRDALGPDRCARLAGVFDSPHLVLRDDGWWPVDDAAQGAGAADGRRAGPRTAASAFSRTARARQPPRPDG
jgi:hypothetical protein